MDISSFQLIAVQYLILLISLTFHECGHAWVAHKMGDDTAYRQGRLSLNPLVHIDIIGTVILPICMMLFASSLGIWGWAKPVEINPHNFKNKKWGDLLVTLAGPFSHIFLAFSVCLLVNLFFSNNFQILQLMKLIMLINSLLFVFNMLPIPPLDGSFMLKKFFHVREETYLYLSQWGFIILIILIQFPFVRYTISICTGLVMSITYVLANLVSWPFHAIYHLMSGLIL